MSNVLSHGNHRGTAVNTTVTTVVVVAVTTAAAVSVVVDDLVGINIVDDFQRKYRQREESVGEARMQHTQQLCMQRVRHARCLQHLAVSPPHHSTESLQHTHQIVASQQGRDHTHIHLQHQHWQHNCLVRCVDVDVAVVDVVVTDESYWHCYWCSRSSGSSTRSSSNSSSDEGGQGTDIAQQPMSTDKH